MKCFKLSFIAIIAIVAIGLTISSSADLFNRTILAPEDYCYTSISSRLTCTSPTVQLSGLTCIEAMAYVDKPVFGISISGRIPLSELLCTGSAIFCCAEIQRISAPICPFQPQFNIDGIMGYYKISAIRCKDE